VGHQIRRLVTESQFLPEYFEREDEREDRLFYAEPRLVVHIDDGAIATVGKLFRDFIPPAAAVLDLMSSWRSHWPPGHPKQRLVGLGLNAVEMADNPDLDEYLVHDVNGDPNLPFEKETFDAVVITVSVQYLTSPIETFQQVNRILRPGGIFIVTFSNRMFPTKAVRVWRNTSDRGHLELVAAYMDHAGNFEDIKGGLANPNDSPPGDPLFVVMGRKGIGPAVSPGT
jgi:SAM-dependent methyltransferase